MIKLITNKRDKVRKHFFILDSFDYVYQNKNNAMQEIVHKCHKIGDFDIFEDYRMFRLRIIFYKSGNIGEKIADSPSDYWALTV